jgi:chromate transporter
MQTQPPTIRQLFWGFLEIGLTGFGGVLPIARRALVDRRRWLSSEDFAQELAVAQLLPGPNIVNLSVAIGLRFAGPAGAVVAFVAILAMPLVILLALLQLYASSGEHPAVSRALHGIAAVAAGLVGAMAWRLAVSLRGAWEDATIVLLAVVAIGILGWPLLPALLVGAALGIAFAARRAAGSKKA